MSSAADISLNIRCLAISEAADAASLHERKKSLEATRKRQEQRRKQLHGSFAPSQARARWIQHNQRQGATLTITGDATGLAPAAAASVAAAAAAAQHPERVTSQPLLASASTSSSSPPPDSSCLASGLECMAPTLPTAAAAEEMPGGGEAADQKGYKNEPPADVHIVNTLEAAQAAAAQLMSSKMQGLTFACDTEVMGIDVR